ncbi:MAG: energy-coupled thiamine transporter ThiT [Synergistaceae bacterium]|nr:energy-coupled thiamine transporter ThiT [Synergistaceae bacterium]
MASHRKHITVMIEGALCIALCIVLEKINIFSMPQGGSVDFELIPLLLFTYRRGIKWGIQAGFITGLVKILLGAYFLNVVQVALDYPLAYACVGLAALHPRIIGLLVAAAGQITCSVISGVVFFAEYAPEGQSTFMYSLMYNMPVLGAKYLLSGIVAMFMWKVLERDLPAAD